MKVGKEISNLKRQGVFKEEVSPFVRVADDTIKSLKKHILFTHKDKDILKKKPKYLKLRLPDDRVVLLVKVEINPNLTTSGGQALTNVILHYRGTLDNDESSIVAFTFSDETMAMISDKSGNHVIGKFKDKHIMYNDADLLIKNPFTCESSELPAPELPTAELTTKCVNWYWEVDYDVFLNKGVNTNAYIQGIFNQVATLYANDGMSIGLKTLFIWTTADPYTGTAGNALQQFGAYRTSWEGDLALLIGFYGSGVAYVGGIQYCPIYGYGYRGIALMGAAGIYSSYSTVPTYSWTVDVVAHEQGHQLGSPHTHACSWNGNGTSIDRCATPTTICPPLPDPLLPVGGGTIMSYCHQSIVGKNLSKGFGPQPAALMRGWIAANTCLTSCTPVPPIPCTDTVQTRSLTCTGGLRNQKRTFACSTSIWGNWITTDSTCTVSPTICPNPYIITCSILQRLNDVQVQRSGFTNYTYKWTKNGVAQSWTGQTVSKTLYTTGNILTVTVSSQGTQTATKCWKTCTTSIIIK